MYNPFRLLFSRLALALLVAQILRLIFFLYNAYFHHFPLKDLIGAFAYGSLYDLSALIYLHSVFILIHLGPTNLFYKKITQRLLLFLFLLAQFVFAFFNLLDTGYYPFAGKRSAIDLFEMRKEADGLKTAYLLDYWYLLLILMALSIAQYFLYQRISRKFKVPNQSASWLPAIGLRLLTLALLFIGVRGGIQLIPMNSFDAARQSRPELVPLVVNTPFNMIISTQQVGLAEQVYMPEDKALALFNPRIFFDSNAVAPKKNLVLIIVESLGKEYVGYYNGGKGYTPFLDSLMQYAEVFEHAYSNGKKSIEGIPAILASMPSWMQAPYLASYYQSNRLMGIGAYLKPMGYDISFYHGGKNGTMSFDNFIALSGGGNYYGENEYPNKADLDGNWGVFDKPYLAYYVKELSAKKAPFFSSLFTLSSHHPYKLPVGDENKYPKGTLPIHPTIAYVDDALRNFFSLAAKEPWYANTTFIITADHSSDNEQARYQSMAGKYEIPLLIFRPAQTQATRVNQTVSQIDLMPMVLSELHCNKPFFSFGSYRNKSVSIPMALQYQDGYYQSINWPWVLQFDGQKVLALYNLQTDGLMMENLVKQGLNIPVADSMLLTTKAMIQTYQNKVVRNKTYIE